MSAAGGTFRGTESDRPVNARGGDGTQWGKGSWKRQKGFGGEASVFPRPVFPRCGKVDKLRVALQETHC